MFKNKYSMLIFSVAGNVFMILVRMFYANKLMYGFLLWNLFLAGIPLIISNRLLKTDRNRKVIISAGLLIWLLFLPNSPYILTDLVHLYERPPVPFWYDMLLVVLTACNGLAVGFISINHIEKMMIQRNMQRYLNVFRIMIIVSMSYGVYLGRYLRFNSWDALVSPAEVMRGMAGSVHLHTAGFVFTFSFLIFVLYGFFRTILLHRSREVF